MLFTNTKMNSFAKDPAVVNFGGKYWLYYTSRHDDGSLGVGIAASADMESWECIGEVTRTQSCSATARSVNGGGGAMPAAPAASATMAA